MSGGRGGRELGPGWRLAAWEEGHDLPPPARLYAFAGFVNEAQHVRASAMGVLPRRQKSIVLR